MLAPKTRRQALRAVLQHGGAMDVDDAAGVVIADAPPGQVWQATGTHSVCQPFGDHAGVHAGRKRDAYGAIVGDVEWGAAPCEEPDCGVCEELVSCHRCGAVSYAWQEELQVAPTDELAAEHGDVLCGPCVEEIQS